MSYRTILAILFNALVLAICFCPSSDEESLTGVDPVVPPLSSTSTVATIVLSGGSVGQDRLLLCRDRATPHDSEIGAAPPGGRTMVCVDVLANLPAQPDSDHPPSELVEQFLHGPALVIQSGQDLVELGL